MWKNNIKIAFRNLWKNKLFTLINITGLSVGLGFLFLTSAYLWQELKVNSVVKDNDRVLVLRSKWKQPEMGLDLTTPARISRSLQENYPDLIEDYYHHDGIASIVSNGDQHFTEGLQPGDATFLRIFGFSLLHGDVATALDEPNTMVITAAKAMKYFGRTDVVGESLTVNSFSGEKQDFEITGVLADLPFNTITHFNNSANEFFLSPGSLRFFGRDQNFEAWQNLYVISYIKLREGVQPESLTQPLATLLKANTTAEIHENLEIYSTPVKDYYLQLDNGSAKRMMYTMACIACFILFMAGINFVNISVSNALTRLKETGVRKVLGGTRRQIIFQHLSESVLFVFLSGLIALALYNIALGPFSEMLGKTLPTLKSYPIHYVLFPLFVIVGIGLIAGIYPALVLAAQPSVASLKGKLKTVNEKVFLRRSLISLQFITAIIVFIAAVMVHKQVSFFFQSNLGYDKEAVIIARTPRDWTQAGVQKMQTLRNEFAQLPEVMSATFSFEVPDGQSGSVSNRLYRASQDPSAAVTTTSLVTDENYAATYGIDLAAGDFFASNESALNTSSMILNETAAKALGWSEVSEAIGQQVKLEGNDAFFTVKGVVKDFHFNTMHEKIRPIFFTHVSNALIYRYLSFKVKPGNMATSIASLQDKWTSLLPEAPFDYTFMDETLARWYQNELQLKKASEVATFIALFLVVLGVIGIVLLAIARKTKEVGIRTVLGASVQQIIWLFAKEFSWVMILANLVGWPIAWVLLQGWLANYAYKVELDLVTFVLTAVVIALLTGMVIVLLVIKTALANPVDSLRSE